ncbi:MAG: hypothetical protein P1S60_01275 [Anaerolineae bacterium]|nr:hypothetical protein [Anaerolineae bacterium]
METVYPYDYEDKSRLWLAEETFIAPGASSWESHGVQTDIVVEGQWEDFTEHNDPALQTAVSYLMEQR